MCFFCGKKVNAYDPYIKDYLFESKEVSLAKIGRLFIAGEGPGGIQFEYSKKAITTPELIDYIKGRTGKKRVLIESDLDSYCELMRQFVNIGKPCEINGVGTIKKMNTSSEYTFTPYDPFAKKEEKKLPPPRRRASSSSNSSSKRSSRSAVMLLALLIIAAVAGVIGWGTYNLFFANKPADNTNDTAALQTTPQLNDTLQNNMQQANTAAPLPPLSATDSAEFKFIHEFTKSSERASFRTGKLRSWGYNSFIDSVNTDSGKVYRLYIPVKLTANDTLRVRDSLFKFFQRPVIVVR